eukprot:CAMPEP_0206459512 /NCGR_PEP_ID=MMETSP0324_2-20121206/24215_1 /ASSEMBLY_ACC=CAM_ASM_000836 /TAXON_ID=2866 /ORGANISM="Crypthecodinium cohnii, Strain Seligo" /LENGTH=135 /DNA_ID=CAMNT_0053931067 /DNA_START=237 /DNA_END=641 /DNA_ORIENTATION=+
MTDTLEAAVLDVCTTGWSVHVQPALGDSIEQHMCLERDPVHSPRNELQAQKADDHRSREIDGQMVLGGTLGCCHTDFALAPQNCKPCGRKKTRSTTIGLVSRVEPILTKRHAELVQYELWLEAQQMGSENGCCCG